MLSAFRRANSQVLKYHCMLEPLEFRYAKANAKDKDKVLPGPCTLVWEKSPRLSKTKPMTGEDGKVTWPPAPQTTPLQLMITMYKKDGKFLSKKTSLKAKIITPKGEEKTVGKAEIDVADYCVDKEISHPIIDIKMGGDCVVRCRLHSRPLPQGAADGDDISMMSGLSTAEEPSTASDWAAGFGKNKAKSGLDSDSDEEDDDDDDDFGGFSTKRPVTKPADKPEPPTPTNAVSDDEFAGFVIPNVKDDPTIVAPQSPTPEVDTQEIEQVMKAEIKPTAEVVEIKPPTVVTTNAAVDIANLQGNDDATKYEELINKYTTQIDQLAHDNSKYHEQLQSLQTQHADDVERFQSIVTLSQTSLHKMQDVVTEYKQREQTYTLQISTLQKKLKENEKSLTTENKRLQKESQILSQDITILNSKINTLKETIKNKEEQEQRFVVQMKTTGDAESILLGEKTQLQTKYQESENQRQLLTTQLAELTKQLNEKSAKVVEYEKAIEKGKGVQSDLEQRNTELKSHLANEKEQNLVLSQRIAQFEHDVAVLQQEKANQVSLVEKKEKELIEIKTILSTTEHKYQEKDTYLADVLKQFGQVQDQVYRLESVEKELQQENGKLSAQLQENKANYAQLQQDLTKAADATNSSSSDQQKQLTLLQNTIAQLEQFKAQALEQEKQYKEQISSLQQENSKKGSSVAQLEKELAKAREDNNASMSRIEQLQSSINTMSSSQGELVAKLQSIEPQYNAQNKTILDFKTTVASQQKTIEEHEATVVELNDQVTTLRGHTVDLEADIEQFKTVAVPTLEKSLKQHKDLIEQYQRTQVHHEQEISALSAALEALKSASKRSNNLHASSSSSSEGVSAEESSALHEGLESISGAELSRLRDEIGFLTTTLEKRTEKIDKLNGEIERLHEEHEEFLQMRQQMEEDFQELEDERDDLDSKLNILTTKYDLLQQSFDKYKQSQGEIDHDGIKQLQEDFHHISGQHQQVKERNEAMKNENAKAKADLMAAEQLVTDLNTKLGITETKLENSEANCKTIIDKSTELGVQLNNELTRAHLENRALRDRIHTFDTLTATVTAIIANAPQVKGNKLESRIVEELIGKIDYYQSQLAEADETLLQTKQTWKQTADVLSRRILELEGQVQGLKKQVNDFEYSRQQEEADQGKMKSTLSQQQMKQEKYQEILSKFEIQIISKKVEIADLTKERDMYKEQVELYENNIESYEQQVTSLRLEVEQLRETLAAVSSQGGQGQKKSKKNKTRQQNDFDLDDADF